MRPQRHRALRGEPVIAVGVAVANRPAPVIDATNILRASPTPLVAPTNWGKAPFKMLSNGHVGAGTGTNTRMFFLVSHRRRPDDHSLERQGVQLRPVENA